MGAFWNEVRIRVNHDRYWSEEDVEEVSARTKKFVESLKDLGAEYADVEIAEFQ